MPTDKRSNTAVSLDIPTKEISIFSPQDVDARMCMSKNTGKKPLTKQSLAESDLCELEVFCRMDLFDDGCPLA
jgi:hypothetical protein